MRGLRALLWACMLLAFAGSAQALVYMSDDFEWNPSDSTWPYHNATGVAATCNHSIQHGWDNEVFDSCPAITDHICSWDDGSGVHPCDWHENGIVTTQHKSGTRSFLNKSYGWQRESGDLSYTFTATPVGSPVWVNFWVMFDGGWASYAPANAEPYMHFFLLNSGQGSTGPRMNLQTFAPWITPHVCGPGSTSGLPSTTQYLFMVPQTDTHDWSAGSFPAGCYNIMSHLNQWLWFSIKFAPPATVGGNGTIEIWIDDVLYYTSTEIWSSNDTACTNAFCKIILSNFRSLFNGSGPFDMGIYYDDLSITDARLTAPAGGGPSAALAGSANAAASATGSAYIPLPRPTLTRVPR